MTHNDPRLFWPVFNMILGSLCGALAWKSSLPDWLRILLVLCALIFGVTACVQLFDWMAHQFAVRTREIQYAKVAHAVNFANAIKGLTNSQTEFVTSQALLKVVGIPGEPVLWTVRFAGGDVELDLIADFIAASRTLKGGYLWPVRQHTDERFKDYSMVEDKITRITNGLIVQEWAEKASGPYSARLKPGITWDYVAEQFCVEA